MVGQLVSSQCFNQSQVGEKIKKEIPEYNRIFDGTVMEQVKISKIFSKNMKVIENIRRNNNK